MVETILLGGNIISVLPAWVTEKSGMKVGKEKRPVFQIIASEMRQRNETELAIDALVVLVLKNE